MLCPIPFYSFTAESQMITVSAEIIVFLTLTESHIIVTRDFTKANEKQNVPCQIGVQKVTIDVHFYWTRHRKEESTRSFSHFLMI